MTASDRGSEDTRDGDVLPDAWLEAAEGYHRPPDTPKAEIWAKIEAELADGSALPLDEFRSDGDVRGRDWLRPALAAAAVLVVGIGIGRMTAGRQGPDPGVEPSGPGSVAAVSEPSEMPAVRTVALEHLGRSESLLTLLRVDARSGRVDREVGAWGRSLLAETRLLLDSPAVEDPALRELLEDLELILAQVVLLDREGGVEGERAREELEIIARGLEERGVLSRIQAVLPAGTETGMTGI